VGVSAQHSAALAPAATGETAPALELRDVRKIFFVQTPSGHAGLLVLDGVSLAVPRRQFVSVLGPSGCGKTTLARIVVGLDREISGEVLLDGAAAGPPGPDRCLVFQNYGLLPWRTVLANVELGLEIQGVPRGRRRATALEYLDMVGLSGFEKRFPHQISGGMQQRTGLARALATRPEMLVMDEPFGALDAQMRTLLQDELLRICELVQSTVLFVTHSIDEAVYLSDRIVVFSARPGRPVADVNVDLPRPRSDQMRAAPEFAAIRKQVSDLLAERTSYYDGGQTSGLHTD
jgi:NitT/TauT family transport system ATP-binding protein